MRLQYRVVANNSKVGGAGSTRGKGGEKKVLGEGGRPLSHGSAHRARATFFFRLAPGYTLAVDRMADWTALKAQRALRRPPPLPSVLPSSAAPGSDAPPLGVSPGPSDQGGASCGCGGHGHPSATAGRVSALADLPPELLVKHAPDRGRGVFACGTLKAGVTSI